MLLPILLSVCLQSTHDVDVLHTYHPRSWYADCLAGPAESSADGRFLLYRFEETVRLFDVETTEVRPLVEVLEWDGVAFATWTPTGLFGISNIP